MNKKKTPAKITFPSKGTVGIVLKSPSRHYISSPSSFASSFAKPSFQPWRQGSKLHLLLRLLVLILTRNQQLRRFSDHGCSSSSSPTSPIHLFLPSPSMSPTRSTAIPSAPCLAKSAIGLSGQVRSSKQMGTSTAASSSSRSPRPPISRRLSSIAPTLTMSLASRLL